MAQNVVVELVDDLDGSPAEETITFALDGKAYEIDLNKRNATALRKLFDKYTAVARRSASRGPRKSGGPAQPYAEARAWAAENGIKTPDRGRLNGEFMEAFAKKSVAAAKKALA